MGELNLGEVAAALREFGFLPRLVGARLSAYRPIGRNNRPGYQQEGHGSRQTRDQWVSPRPTIQPFRPPRRPGQDRFAAQEPAEIVRHLAGRRVTTTPFFGHRLQTYRFQVSRDFVVDSSRRPWLLMH